MRARGGRRPVTDACERPRGPSLPRAKAGPRGVESAEHGAEREISEIYILVCFHLFFFVFVSFPARLLSFTLMTTKSIRYYLAARGMGHLTLGMVLGMAADGDRWEIYGRSTGDLWALSDL